MCLVVIRRLHFVCCTIRNSGMRVCQIKLVVAYGEKSFKSMQIIQIFFLFVICLICNDLWDFCAKRTPFFSRLWQEPVVDVQRALINFWHTLPWDGLESPSHRLGKVVIRAFILCVAQFVTRERKQKFRVLFRLPLAYSYFAASRRR